MCDRGHILGELVIGLSVFSIACWIIIPSWQRTVAYLNRIKHQAIEIQQFQWIADCICREGIGREFIIHPQSVRILSSPEIEYRYSDTRIYREVSGISQSMAPESITNCEFISTPNGVQIKLTGSYSTVTRVCASW